MRSIFVTGSGQCGETFLYNLCKRENIISAKDESRPLLHSYYRFIKFNKLKIDETPLFNELKKNINKSNKSGKINFESSSHLALHTLDIYRRYKSKIIILIRNPIDVAYSLKKKGWYKYKYIKEKKNYVIGYQGVATNAHNKHHNFTRLSPKGEFFYKWNNFNQLLKIKWYWHTIYSQIFKDLKTVPKNNYRILRIEDLNYQKYLELSKWIGIKPKINRFFFNMRVKIVKANKYKKNSEDLKTLSKFKSSIEKTYYKENLKFKY